MLKTSTLFCLMSKILILKMIFFFSKILPPLVLLVTDSEHRCYKKNRGNTVF